MEKDDFNERTFVLHKKFHGKLESNANTKIKSKDDFSLIYSLTVAAPCTLIADDHEQAYNLITKGRTVVFVSNGSAILGLWNIGAKPSIPNDLNLDIAYKVAQAVMDNYHE